METAGENSSKSNFISAKLNKIKTDAVHIAEITKRLAQDDPRRVVHSFKVGFALALVSLFYYFDPIFDGFGVNAMWAVLTTVVVFEFSVGATLGKGVNRVIATIIGGMIAVGAHRLSGLPGEKTEPLFLGTSVFITATAVTFMRFYPKLKARFDYGMLIFILTFCLICVSGYRDSEVLDMAHRRISSLLIGSTTAMIVCVVIWPVWASNDLHKLTASHIEKLGKFLEEFGDEYFKTAADQISKDCTKASWVGFNNILDSKTNVHSLHNFARWEPRHGRFKKDHPWSQYKKICELTRHCACTTQALLTLLLSETQAPEEVKAKFEKTCLKMSIETGKAMKELSLSIRKMTQPSKAESHIEIAKQASQDLDLMLRSTDIWKDFSLSDVTQAVTVSSTLVDVVTGTEEIAEAVQELASLVKFKSVKLEGAKVAAENNGRSKLAKQTSINRRSFNSHVIIVDGSCEDPPSLAMAQNNAE